MVAIMFANNETGVIQPIREIARMLKPFGAVFVVDAVQAAGRIQIDIGALGIDFLLLSSHKIGGPKGSGAIVSAGEMLMPVPLITGGGQERGHRSGTENPAAIAGFGAAAERALAGIDQMKSILALRDRMEVGMRAIAPDVVIYGETGERLPNTSFFALPGLKAETAQIAFDLEGVALSAGSACSAGKVGPSHVLSAMGQDADLGALRVSLGPSTLPEDIDGFLDAFGRINAKRARG
jgi:cysteine desulfurase